MKNLLKSILLSFIVLIPIPGSSYADQFIDDDLIVVGNECLGFDCTNGYSFGFDTLVMKENNLRIYFYDTSNSASFPANDWRITINDSANGGLNKFSIDDATNGKTPFTIEANATTHSLYIDTSSRIGFGTNAPTTLLHALNGNTPTLRLDQSSAGGWGTYTWDVAANEANFFIRDVSGGSTLPFRILPGASSNSICIDSDSNVGLGISNATASLHIKKTGLTSTNNMLLIQNDTLDTLTLDGVGNLTAAGTISHGSSRAIKKEINKVNADDILEQLLQLDIYTWQYKTDDNITHLGPMAEDFGELFHLGKDNTHLAPGDMGGIAFAAIQSLSEKVTDRDQKISALEKENAELSERLERLENLVGSMMDNN